jgi:hypothetical protein
MDRDTYRIKWSTNHQRKGYIPVVPANIERREFHEPCFLCGEREGCKHRRAA